MCVCSVPDMRLCACITPTIPGTPLSACVQRDCPTRYAPLPKGLTRRRRRRRFFSVASVRDDDAGRFASSRIKLAPLRRGRGVGAGVQSAPRVCRRRSVAPLRGGGWVPRGLRRPALHQASALAPSRVSRCSRFTAFVLP